jgi:hypothetical protein
MEVRQDARGAAGIGRSLAPVSDAFMLRRRHCLDLEWPEALPAVSGWRDGACARLLQPHRDQRGL